MVMTTFEDGHFRRPNQSGARTALLQLCWPLPTLRSLLGFGLDEPVLRKHEE